MSKLQLLAIYSKSIETQLRAKSLYETYLKSYLPNFIYVVWVAVVDTIDTPYLFQDGQHILVNSESPEQTMFQALADKFPDIGGCLKCDDTIIPNMLQIRGLLEHMGNANIGCISKTSEPSYTDPMYYLNLQAMTNPPDTTLQQHLQDNQLSISEYALLYSEDFSNIRWFSIYQPSPKPVLFITIDSGLGNQMFKIASAYGIARKNDMTMVVIAYNCSNTHNSNPYSYFNTIFLGIPHIHDNRVVVTNKYQEPTLDCWTYNPNIITSHDDMLLGGYFQNEKYFEEYRDEIAKMFLRPDILERLSKQYPQAKNSYFIHVRRGDYVNNHLYMMDVDKYYSAAIQHVLEKNPSAHFYVFSNDVPFCKQWPILKPDVPEPPETMPLMWDPSPKKPPLNLTFVENLDEVESLYLMTLCRLGGICANSTYSWWGSYLNDNPDKLVILPKRWFNNPSYSFQDIFYKGTVVLDS